MPLTYRETGKPVNKRCRKPGDCYRVVILGIRGQVSVLRPARPDGFLTTADAAALVGVRPVTIRQWRARGWLEPQGLDERGHPLHTREAVQAAELAVRRRGIEVSGIDPRLLRKRDAALARTLVLVTDDPIGDALRADAEAARDEIRSAGLICPSCGKNAGDSFGWHSLILISEPDRAIPVAECRDGQRVPLEDWNTIQAAANIALMDDFWFRETLAFRDLGFPA